MYVRRIPEHAPTHPAAGRLGRHVRHDPRSLRYLVTAKSLGDLTSVRHQRYIPVLDQGDLGSCTGNAALGAVGTGALFQALLGGLREPSTTNAAADEVLAVSLYSSATHLDDYDGSYPPEDTGSDGLSVAKACVATGLVSGYTHATSLEAALTALESQAVITGVNWYDSFDQPNADGLITITKRASVRGGHEFELEELDVTNRLVWFTNSWTEQWGVEGRACIGWDDFGRLLDEQGDVTAFVPLSQPAPTPTPDPSDGELAGCLGTAMTALQKAVDLVKGGK
ncbi:MAG: hypothetical protein ACRDP6_14615 [Actinoallomurus sp.]